MSTPFNAALSAYGAATQLISQGSSQPSAAKLISQISGGAQPSVAGAAQDPDFAKLLAESVQGVINTGNHSDKMALDMVNGKANVVDVVTAISETEIAMESMVTVRDRVISAYEEIMRMPI